MSPTNAQLTTAPSPVNARLRVLLRLLMKVPMPPPMRRLLCLGLIVITPIAGASPFVSYDFSSHDAGLPIAGTLSFSAGMPVVDRCCYWVSYQPSAVVTLQLGDRTWSNAATPGGYCGVWFHVGWVQVAVWCPLAEPFGELGVTAFRLDFYADRGGTASDDPDPTGPYQPDTFKDLRVSGHLFAWNPANPDPWGRLLSLDDVRITPYIDEPDLPLLLATAAAAAGAALRRRRQGERQRAADAALRLQAGPLRPPLSAARCRAPSAPAAPGRAGR